MDTDIKELNLENIDFLKDNLSEGLHLEYKQSYTSKIEHTVCAFLNTQGGWIILGVEEGNDKITSYHGVDESFMEKFRMSFTLLDPYFDWDPDILSKGIKLENGKLIYVLKIHNSDHSHKRNGIYYYRYGSQTLPLHRDSQIIELKKEKGEVDEFGRELQRYRKIPKKNYTRFIGRNNVYKELLEELRGHHYIISIDGIGGVGKSTLALEIAHKCFEARIFDSILWFSAKKEKLTLSQITTVDPDFDNLDTLLERTAFEFRIPYFEKFTEENKIEVIINFLKKNSVLLILDNLETIRPKQNLTEFLAKIEGKSKVLITSRERIGQLERIIALNPFTLENTKDFVDNEGEARAFIITKEKENIYEELYRLTAGVPLAIKIMMGWIIDGIVISKLENKLKESKEDILKFCFEETYNHRLSFEAKKLLCSFSVLPNDINYEELKACVDIESEKLDKAISMLLNYSLITIQQIFSEVKEEIEVYNMLPLTKIFGFSKIDQFTNLERKTVQRYNNYIKETKQFLTDLEILKQEENLVGLNKTQQKAYLKARRAVKLFEDGDYTSALGLFREAERLADDIPEVYYMWANVESNLEHYGMSDELFERATHLNPDNPTYWLSWAGFHKRHKNEERAKGILIESLNHTPSHKQHVLRRELGIILGSLNEFNRSLEILKENLISKPGKENDFILNTKTMNSILTTYIFQARYYEKNKQYEIAQKKFIEAFDYFKSRIKIVNQEDGGLIWRIKQIYRGFARRIGYFDFEKGIEYYLKAYYDNPKRKREKKENHYFIMDWTYFVKHWINRGKQKEDFTVDFEDVVKDLINKVKPTIVIKRTTFLDQDSIEFEIGESLLIETVENVLSLNKPPRYAVIDNYMRKNKEIKYKGAVYIRIPGSYRTFSTFTEFVDKILQRGKIKIIEKDGFKEIHLNRTIHKN